MCARVFWVCARVFWVRARLCWMCARVCWMCVRVFWVCARVCWTCGLTAGWRPSENSLNSVASSVPFAGAHRYAPTQQPSYWALNRSDALPHLTPPHLTSTVTLFSRYSQSQLPGIKTVQSFGPAMPFRGLLPIRFHSSARVGGAVVAPSFNPPFDVDPEPAVTSKGGAAVVHELPCPPPKLGLQTDSFTAGNSRSLRHIAPRPTLPPWLALLGLPVGLAAATCSQGLVLGVFVVEEVLGVVTVSLVTLGHCRFPAFLFTNSFQVYVTSDLFGHVLHSLVTKRPSRGWTVPWQRRHVTTTLTTDRIGMRSTALWTLNASKLASVKFTSRRPELPRHTRESRARYCDHCGRKYGQNSTELLWLKHP